MRMSHTAPMGVASLFFGFLCAFGPVADRDAVAQTVSLVQPWGLPPLPAVVGPVENFAFGGPDNQSIYFQSIYLEGATSGTFWRFKAPYPGLIGPGGVRLPAQP